MRLAIWITCCWVATACREGGDPVDSPDDGAGSSGGAATTDASEEDGPGQTQTDGGASSSASSGPDPGSGETSGDATSSGSSGPDPDAPSFGEVPCGAMTCDDGEVCVQRMRCDWDACSGWPRNGLDAEYVAEEPTCGVIPPSCSARGLDACLVDAHCDGFDQWVSLEDGLLTCHDNANCFCE